MQQKDIYYVNYQDTSVNGLQIGGAVKYYGLDIGRVEDIKISKEDINNVIVKISIKEGTPIKSDMKAQLIAVGITGLKQIELIGGTNQAETLEPGDFIKPGKSTLDNITGKAEIVAAKLELVLTNLAKMTNEENRIKLSRILTNTDSLIHQNRQSFTNMMTNLDSTSLYLAKFMKNSNLAMDKFNTLLRSPELQNILDNISKTSSDIAQADLKKIMNDLNEAIYNANEAFLHIDLTVLKGRDDLLNSLNILKETIDNLNDFSRQISEDPTLLIRPKK
jgi:phospholipid/cholesterol/gamma-HCH transport system substrate-binding protein